MKPLTPESDLLPRGQKTRDRLLGAGSRVFSERGYHSTRVEDIVVEAKTSHGTFYLYFPDKKSVFIELVKTLSHNLRAAIATAVADGPDRVDAEQRGLEVFFDYITRHRCFYKLVRESEFVDPPLFRWYYERFAEDYMPGLTTAVE